MPTLHDPAAVALETLNRARDAAADNYCAVFSHWDALDGIPYANARVAWETARDTLEDLTDPHARLMALLEHPNAKIREAAMLATEVA